MKNNETCEVCGIEHVLADEIVHPEYGKNGNPIIEAGSVLAKTIAEVASYKAKMPPSTPRKDSPRLVQKQSRRGHGVLSPS